MQFSVETWDPAYGSAIESLELESTADDVDPAIEVPPAAWRPIACTPSDAARAAAEPLWFVDGVRRIDARVWISSEGRDGPTARPGVCASVAAGAVRVGDGAAEVAGVIVGRGLYTTPEGAGPIATKAGAYALRPTTDTTEEASYLAIHEHLTELEAHVTADADADDVVIVDGPLRGRSAEHVVGYVKTHHVHYLPDDLRATVARLDPGQRTPLFLLGGRQTRYSWYLRLPGARAHPLAAVVRCEIPARGEVGRAAERASCVTAVLQCFGSEPHKEARAPQNLYPIAGLEHRLRHRLGDQRLLERALRVAAA